MMDTLFAEVEERRDKLQIFADIIKVASKPSKITKILRVANIQYATFQDCVDKLCTAGFLEVISNLKYTDLSRDKRTTYIFRATDMGLKWCQKVEEIYKLLDFIYTSPDDSSVSYSSKGCNDIERARNQGIAAGRSVRANTL